MGAVLPPLFEAVHPLLFFALFRSGIELPGKEGTGILQGRHHENFLRTFDRKKAERDVCRMKKEFFPENGMRAVQTENDCLCCFACGTLLQR